MSEQNCLICLSDKICASFTQTKNNGSSCSTDKRSEDRGEKTQSSQKGRSISQQSSAIKALENNSSDRWITLPATWEQRQGHELGALRSISSWGWSETSHVQVSRITVYWLMNEFRGGCTNNTDTHGGTHATGAFLRDQTGRQRSSWQSALGYECLPSSQRGRSSTVRRLTFLAFYRGQASQWM